MTPLTNFLRVNWRLERIPRAPGTNPDGRLNNWWPYIVTHWLYPLRTAGQRVKRHQGQTWQPSWYAITKEDSQRATSKQAMELEGSAPGSEAKMRYTKDTVEITVKLSREQIETESGTIYFPESPNGLIAEGYYGLNDVVELLRQHKQEPQGCSVCAHASMLLP